MPVTEVVTMSGKMITAVCFIVLLLVASGLWLFRYAPLGNQQGSGGGIYAYDRLTGRIMWIFGDVQVVVSNPAKKSSSLLEKLASQSGYFNKSPKPVTDPEILKQLNKPLVPEGFVLGKK
jgi:hypothetical protein